MANFGDVAKSGWSTDDGAHTFCVPMASVIHGFIYNKTAFEELGIEVPKTQAEFFAALDKIKEDGTYIPMAMGTNDQWEAATMGYQNIGPNYWKGEEGRLALIAGEQKLTDPQWVAPVHRDREVEGLPRRRLRGADLPRQPEPVHPRPRRDLSGRLVGDRAVRGADRRRLRDGRLPAAGAGRGRHLLHLRPRRHRDRAERRLAERRGREDSSSNGSDRRSSPTLYANALPGFFSLLNEPVTLEDPLAQEFVAWRDTCESTIRSTYQILSRGTPNLENETWNARANVIRGTETPEDAAKRLQDGLASWYDPQK